MNKSITIKIKGIDSGKIIGINIEEIHNSNMLSIDEDKIIDIDMDKNIYLAILIEMKKANIAVDEDLNCLRDRIFTISEREWFRAPKELWKPDEKTGELAPPKTFAVALRKDLEYILLGKDLHEKA